jgi:hypothetical protein
MKNSLNNEKVEGEKWSENQEDRLAWSLFLTLKEKPFLQHKKNHCVG